MNFRNILERLRQDSTLAGLPLSRERRLDVGMPLGLVPGTLSLLATDGDKPTVVVTPTGRDGEELVGALAAYLPRDEVEFFPSWTVVTTDILSLVVKADATAIPENIEVDVEGKPEGTQIRIADIVFPESVTTEMDPEDLVVSVIVPQADAAIEEVDAALAAEQSAEDEAPAESGSSEEDSE